MLNEKTMQTALDKLTVDELERVVEMAHVTSDVKSAEGRPQYRVELPANVTPRVLHGTVGTVGRKRRKRVEFFPEVGSEAYAKGRTWRITPTLLKPVGDAPPVEQVIQGTPGRASTMTLSEMMRQLEAAGIKVEVPEKNGGAAKAAK